MMERIFTICPDSTFPCNLLPPPSSLSLHVRVYLNVAIHHTCVSSKLCGSHVDDADVPASVCASEWREVSGFVICSCDNDETPTTLT